MADFSERYQAGVNLGGWLSQYGTFDHDHFEEFVGESDVERIADWGMDHVRLPIDYPVLVDDGDADGYSDRGFGYVDDCLRWCREHDLDLVVDLHQAPGYSFSTLDENRLFEDEELQDRFVDVWRTFAERYESAGDEVAFELLNEVVHSPDGAWNDLAHRAVDAIRAVDADRDVVVGGERYNSIDALEDIALVEGDDNVVYTFHFYEPHLFTHQHASWSEVARAHDRDVEYPGTVPGLDAFLDDHPEYREGYESLVGERVDREWIEAAVQPAVEFRRETGEDLYCGEYGVIDVAPADSRLAWYRDVVDVLSNLDIGRACWSYREMNFGLVDENGAVVNEELVDVVSRA